MNLCEAYDLGLVQVGSKCISAIGTPGIVTYFNPTSDGRYDGEIVIEWENGNKTPNVIYLSDCPWLDAVTFCVNI